MSCITTIGPEYVKGYPLPQSSPAVTSSKLRRLYSLAESLEPKIRETVAACSYVPEELLWRLSRDVDEGVRSWVARNPRTPRAILHNLEADRSEVVRGWVKIHHYIYD